MERNFRKVREGVVVSDKMTKSIIVEVERRVKHPKYGKFLRKTSRFMAHDENEESHVGDTVRIIKGTLEGTEGKILSIDKDTGACRVETVFFGRATPVDVDFSDIEKI